MRGSLRPAHFQKQTSQYVGKRLFFSEGISPINPKDGSNKANAPRLSPEILINSRRFIVLNLFLMINFYEIIEHKIYFDFFYLLNIICCKFTVVFVAVINIKHV